MHWVTQDDPARWDRQLPTIFVANHTNWWDGFIGYLVNRALGLSFHVLMEARNLARYPAFRLIGALPMRRESAREAYVDLAAAHACLRASTGLWIFPQGERRPPSERLVNCERGAAHLALTYGAPLRFCAVALRYTFVSEQLPEAFALVGDEWLVDQDRYASRRTLMDLVSRRLQATLDDLDARLRIEDLTAFRPLVRGKLSVNKRFDRFRHAIGLLDGPFERRNG